jgi:signal transduction histidine kinase
MKLRSHLLFLALATLLPVLAFALYVSSLLVERERETFRRGAADQTRAILTAVDLHLNGTIAALEALALSPALDRNDLSAFHASAQRVLASRPDWRTLQLATPSGTALIDAATTFGRPLPPLDSAPYVAQVVGAARPAVGNISRGSGAEHFVPIVVPVVRYGDVRFVISATVDPRTFSEVLEAQRLPADWVGAILDSSFRIVTRTRDAERFAGSPATEDLRRQMTASEEGWYRGRTLDGTAVYGAFERSDFSRWSIAIGVPAEVLDAGAQRTRWLMAGGIVGAVALALLLATIVSRKLAAPLTELAAAAHALRRGDAVRSARVQNIDELEHLAAALNDAAAAVRTRETQQKAAEEALRAADRQKDNFLAMLGHELRNPLSAIASASQILRRTQAHPDLAANAVGVIDRQVRHMARLIEDLLDVSRVTRGTVELVRQPLDLGALVAGIVAAWRTAGRFDAHTVAAATEPVWVEGDAARLEQIVTNLLENALKYTPAGGAVDVTVRRDGADAVFEVLDTGTGLTHELAERMFELFVQGERPLDRNQGGLGIGLTLVKRLAELHGGKVAGASAGPGRGSSFSVRLPAIAPPAPESVNAAPPDDKAPRRILVVEDNDDAREALVLALQTQGHEVSAARDGPGALAVLDGFRPDVALLDIGLPGMDGYALAAELRRRCGSAPPLLVALTGYGQPEDRARSRAAGFDEHLVKPVSMDDLERVLVRARA